MKYYYCYSIKEGLFDDEMDYAKELGVYIFYDENKDKFFDKDGIEFDIKGKSIFPRTGVYQQETLSNAIIDHEGNPLVTKEDYEKTTNWPNYIKTKRKNIIISGKNILENPIGILSLFGDGQIFFKTKEKNFAEVIATTNFLKDDSSIMQAIEEHKEEDFIISDVVSIEEDEFGLLEYRAFIINNKIMNISRVSDYLLSNVPQEVIDKLNGVMLELKETNFPKSYVIDFFIYKNELGIDEVDVLECNPIISSGLYLYNSVFEQIEDLHHKCPSMSIPREKLKYPKSKHYSFNVKETRRPSICYNLPGGFAADLTAITLFGSKTSKNMFFHFAPSHICIPNFISEEPKKKTLKKEKK